MISLNLLPPTDRIDALLKWHYLIAKNVITMVLISSLVIAVALQASKMVLLKELDQAKSQVDQIQTNQSEVNNKITTTNMVVSEIIKIQSRYQPISEFLYRTLAVIPAGVVIYDIQLDTPENTIQISGRAMDRDLLLEAETAWEKIDFIKKVDIPLSNLLKKEDIRFSLRIELDPTKLPSL